MPSENQITLDFSGPVMTDEERDVWSVLSMCRGRALAILGPEIEELTGIKYKHIQKIISHLVCDHKMLIGSGTFGYYIPRTREEVADAAHYLRHRAIVALYRASEMQRASIEEVFGQARLEYEKAG